MKHNDLKLWIVRFILFVIPFIYGIFLFFHIKTVGKIFLILPLIWDLIVVGISVYAIFEIFRYRHELKKFDKEDKK